MKNVPERPKSLMVTMMILGFAMIVSFGKPGQSDSHSARTAVQDRDEPENPPGADGHDLL